MKHIPVRNDLDSLIKAEYSQPLSLTNNAWKSVTLDQTITADTVLSFEFRADALGEIHGIGFDNDASISSDLTFQLAGTQTWGIQGATASYDVGDGWQRYDIRVGDYFTGDYDRLVFAMDDDAGASGDSAFRNVEITSSPTRRDQPFQ